MRPVTALHQDLRGERVRGSAAAEGQVPEGLLREGQPEGVRRDQGRQEVAARQRQQCRRGVPLQDTLAGAVEVQVKVADKAGEKIVSCS